MGVVSSCANEKFIVRFSADMRDRISCIAQENRRGMNSEIVMRIDRSLVRGGFQTGEVMHLDDTELSPHERELLV